METKGEQKIELLEEALRNLNVPLMHAEKKDLIKRNVFQRLSVRKERVELPSLNTLIGAILRVVSDLRLSSVKRAEIKEGIMAVIDGALQKRFFWSNFLALGAKALSFVLVVAIGLGVVGVLNQKPFVVRAATFTSFQGVSGNVVLRRNGVYMPAYRGLALIEGDEIATSQNSFAEVGYFDDSITRLSENTKDRKSVV